jgi:hypothetical protein
MQGYQYLYVIGISRLGYVNENGDQIPSTAVCILSNALIECGMHQLPWIWMALLL